MLSPDSKTAKWRSGYPANSSVSFGDRTCPDRLILGWRRLAALCHCIVDRIFQRTTLPSTPPPSSNSRRPPPTTGGSPMPTHKLLLLPGDGIGPEVIAEV